jgi:hypothetical protein
MEPRAPKNNIITHRCYEGIVNGSDANFGGKYRQTEEVQQSVPTVFHKYRYNNDPSPI